jgi:hypothetical protein
MQFDIGDSLDILKRTPFVLETLLSGLKESWISHNEGENTWSPFDVMGHLIHGEKTDWIPRMMIILRDADDKKFVPFNMFAQFTESRGKTLEDLIKEFKILRAENLRKMEEQTFTEEMLKKKGIHPELGEVTLEQLLATWVVHDLAHICQISRVMAKQYKTEIGPWARFFSIFNKPLANPLSE